MVYSKIIHIPKYQAYGLKMLMLREGRNYRKSLFFTNRVSKTMMRNKHSYVKPFVKTEIQVNKIKLLATLCKNLYRVLIYYNNVGKTVRCNFINIPQKEKKE